MTYIFQVIFAQYFVDIPISNLNNSIVYSLNLSSCPILRHRFLPCICRYVPPLRSIQARCKLHQHRDDWNVDLHERSAMQSLRGGPPDSRRSRLSCSSWEKRFQWRLFVKHAVKVYARPPETPGSVRVDEFAN